MEDVGPRIPCKDERDIFTQLGTRLYKSSAFLCLGGWYVTTDRNGATNNPSSLHMHMVPPGLVYKAPEERNTHSAVVEVEEGGGYAAVVTIEELDALVEQVCRMMVCVGLFG